MSKTFLEKKQLIKSSIDKWLGVFKHHELYEEMLKNLNQSIAKCTESIALINTLDKFFSSDFVVAMEISKEDKDDPRPLYFSKEIQHMLSNLGDKDDAQEFKIGIINLKKKFASVPETLMTSENLFRLLNAFIAAMTLVDLVNNPSIGKTFNLTVNILNMYVSQDDSKRLLEVKGLFNLMGTAGHTHTLGTGIGSLSSAAVFLKLVTNGLGVSSALKGISQWNLFSTYKEHKPQNDDDICYLKKPKQ